MIGLRIRCQSISEKGDASEVWSAVRYGLSENLWKQVVRGPNRKGVHIEGNRMQIVREGRPERERWWTQSDSEQCRREREIQLLNLIKGWSGSLWIIPVLWRRSQSTISLVGETSGSWRWFFRSTPAIRWSDSKSLITAYQYFIRAA